MCHKVKNFIPQFTPQIRKKDMDAVYQQMMTGWIGPSNTTIVFEEQIKKITGAKHCISTTSGTTAIMLAIKSLNLKEGSTILFPAYTFLAGANACRMLGYRIQLIDIKPETLCMDPALVKQVLDKDNSSHITCVIFVNHNAYVGQDVQTIKALCNDKNIVMLEDSCQALGMPYAGRTGKVGVFSFSVPKLVTTGQGGAIITDDDEIADNCLAWRDHGDDNWRNTKIHTRIGGNFKFNDILASYGLSQLYDIEELLSQRKVMFDRYRHYIDLVDYGYDSTWMVVYRSKNVFARAIVNNLHDQDIQAAQYYRQINNNPPYACDDSCVKAALAYRDIVYLPSSLSLTEKDIGRICATVIEVEGDLV